VLFCDEGHDIESLKGKRVEIVSVGRPGFKHVSTVVKRATNAFCARILSLPHPFLQESWIDRFLFPNGIDFFLNLGPDALSLSVPYLCAVFDLQHRYQPYMPEVSLRGYWERWDEKYSRILGRATFVITGTDAGEEEIRFYYRVPGERILKLPHPTPEFALAGADNPATAVPSSVPGDRPFLFYPAQFWAHKNHVTLLEALRELREDGFDLSLVLVGSDQGNLEFVRNRALELGVIDRVFFPGFVSRDDLIALYRHAAALVYPSTCGPENLPPLEAFALGCPVIAGLVPGAVEQLSDAALLVPPTDAVAVAGAVKTLLTNPDRRAELVRLGRQRAQRFTRRDFARGIFIALDGFEAKRKCWPANVPYKRRHDVSRLLSN
jgi:glycosyltransferase involved in cell wall biosynthesis